MQTVGVAKMKLEPLNHPAPDTGPRAEPDDSRVHVAIVHTDPRALQALDRDLRRRGFAVTAAGRPGGGSRGILPETGDVALLDMRSPEGDGYAVLRRLREHSDLPVVLLTDSEDEVEEIVGLRMGADAVLRRPWSPQLLAERIRALSRRARIGAGQTRAGANRLSLPPLEIDLDKMTASWRGTALQLTGTEFRLLHALAERPGHVRTRDVLMDRLYGNDIYVLDRTVDSHVKRLRRKLRDADPSFDAIETLYGTGYKMTLPDPAAGASLTP
jgi:two-component system response regulator ChvI